MSEYRTYLSERGIPLVYIDPPRDKPVLTVENYCKWYGFHLVHPDGSVTSLSSDDYYEIQSHDPSAISGDHLYSPRLYYRIVAALNLRRCSETIDMITGRWVREFDEAMSRHESLTEPADNTQKWLADKIKPPGQSDEEFFAQWSGKGIKPMQMPKKGDLVVDAHSVNAVREIERVIKHGGVILKPGVSDKLNSTMTDEIESDLLKKVSSGSYARREPTAIGGTLRPFGRNVYWQLVVDKVEDLPEKSTVGIKAFVRSSKSVYDATESGWKWNLSDTKFISGLEIESNY